MVNKTFPYPLNLYLKHHVVLFCAPTIANFYPENRKLKLSTFLLSYNDRLVKIEKPHLAPFSQPKRGKGKLITSSRQFVITFMRQIYKKILPKLRVELSMVAITITTNWVA